MKEQNITGLNIKALRCMHELSQSQLASFMQQLGFNFDKNSIYTIENMRRRILDIELYAIAKIFIVPVNYLFDFPENYIPTYIILSNYHKHLEYISLLSDDTIIFNRLSTSNIVGQKLKSLRENRELRQTDIARSLTQQGLPLSKCSVCEMEHGNRRVTDKHIVLFSKIFDIPINFLF